MESYVITTAIIRDGDRYLIAKRAAAKKFAAGQWEFISGFMDSPESPEETIVREIKEELGVSGKVIGKSAPFTIIDEEGDWRVQPFLVELDDMNIMTNQNDHSEAKWVTAEELNEFADLKPFLDDAGIRKLLRIKI